MPHGTRLYSIAATRYGDNFDGKTTSLCVRRATFWDSEKNAEDPEKKGLCSNFLCDAKPGDEIKMTGQKYGHSHFCMLHEHRCSTAQNSACSLGRAICLFDHVSGHELQMWVNSSCRCMY